MCFFSYHSESRPLIGMGARVRKKECGSKLERLGLLVAWWLPCLPFGPGPGLGLVAALPPIWSDLTTDAGDKRIHHRRWEKFKGGQGGQGACGAGNEGKPTALESRRTNHPVNLFPLIKELNITEARIVFV